MKPPDDDCRTECAAIIDPGGAGIAKADREAIEARIKRHGRGDDLAFDFFEAEQLLDTVEPSGDSCFHGDFALDRLAICLMEEAGGDGDSGVDAAFEQTFGLELRAVRS